jgi:hypothetical protein
VVQEAAPTSHEIKNVGTVDRFRGKKSSYNYIHWTQFRTRTSKPNAPVLRHIAELQLKTTQSTSKSTLPALYKT